MKVKEVLFGVAGLAKLDWFITGNERTFRRRSSVADLAELAELDFRRRLRKKPGTQIQTT